MSRGYRYGAWHDGPDPLAPTRWPPPPTRTPPRHAHPSPPRSCTDGSDRLPAMAELNHRCMIVVRGRRRPNHRCMIVVRGMRRPNHRCMIVG